MIASLQNLVDMFDEGQIVDWKMMAIFGVPNELLEPNERKLVRRARNSSDPFFRKHGVNPRELLCRIVSLLDIEYEVEFRLNGRSSFRAIKGAVMSVLASAGKGRR